MKHLSTESAVQFAAPERQLWAAVVVQALFDATSDETPTEQSGSKRARRDARSWLLGNSRDFRAVCSFAEVDPHAVQQKAKLICAGDWLRRDIDPPRAAKAA